MSAAEVPVRRQKSARGEGDRLRHDLLESAANLMATHGDVDSISLRAVARDAGVSPTAVYRHFPDHLTLLREASDYCWTNLREALATARRSSTDPFISFRAHGEAYIQFAIDHPGQYRVLFSNKLDLGGESSAVGRACFQLLLDDVTTILGLLDDDRDAHFVAAQVHTWIHGIVDLRNTHPDVPWPGTTELLDGLGETLRLYPGAENGGATG
jgi:AcrR family transcriptional regulator